MPGFAGQVPSGGCSKGNHTLMFLSLSFSPLSLSKNKINKIFFKNEANNTYLIAAVRTKWEKPMKCQIHSRCSISIVFNHAGSYLDGFIVEKFAFVLITFFMLSISQNPLPISFSCLYFLS
ncbi:hypothetical protein HJG60_011875 [Phyllostomus discolor]|uniref:Uncharacterized protein n=1 Tax=Phyllostomus discolor TaxID=89673 RepID=A0A834DST6_9CHIR|nr:hypothetical protein HJG60_011875 [Phyllostomus discolor]